MEEAVRNVVSEKPLLSKKETNQAKKEDVDLIVSSLCDYYTTPGLIGHAQVSLLEIPRQHAERAISTHGDVRKALEYLITPQ